MFNKLAIVASTLLPLALGAPTGSAPTEKRSTDLNCVQYQYGGPFTYQGFNGFIHLYSNITKFDSETQTTSFNETRLSSAEDGTIQPCGECRTTKLFGFEVCQTSDRLGFNGLENSPRSFYGHLTYYNVGDFKCLQASTSPYEGASLQLADCQYDYEGAASSGQYFEMNIADDGYWYAFLIDEHNIYGPNPQLNNNESLVLYNPIAPNATFTYFGFKAIEY
ncbi:uncharacterized protein L201_007097 [Kwoniella dendrophila CBS 6074]|uniref:Uncharacterized protein n=1 Tax=Kwoniella dendrophila CBS 6074 TaxID=1295534 RepID=A0AAX4K5X3_9TREE